MLSVDSCSFLPFFFLSSSSSSICLFCVWPNYIWLISSNLSTTTIMSSTTTTGAHSVRWGVSGCAWMCMGVCGCAWVCECVCGMISQNIYWRIESLHQRTLIRILYEFFNFHPLYLFQSSQISMFKFKQLSSSLFLIIFRSSSLYLVHDMQHSK